MVKISKKKKPEILKTKIELANLIRKKIKPISFQKSPVHNFYWSGSFEINGLIYYIYFQYYSRGIRRMQVDYIGIRHNHNNKALSVKEINKLLESLK